MKNTLLTIFFVLALCHTSKGQTKASAEHIITTNKKGKTTIRSLKNGQLQIDISKKDIAKFKGRGFVNYSDLNAKGDGKTDDINAIAATHSIANRYNLSVKANKGATYYIGGKAQTADIKTNTDFGTAKFIIDDTKLENHKASVFIVTSNHKLGNITTISTLQKNQKRINITLNTASVITAVDANKKRYIRFGLNQNNGANQTDIFIVDKNGNVDSNTPIIWDFTQITKITALPIDETTLNITGGHFTTIANKAESKYNYHKRNIAITRSNVIINGLEHHIIGEGEHGAPYQGFIDIQDCANVTVKNTLLTGHKKYETIGAAGKPVLMGTYDITVKRALNITFENCSQTNDINDGKYWGIMASNYSKNIIYDHCKLSRFDAHMGVANATIRNSSLGHGINAIGSGTLTVENSTVHGINFINLRSDYGSTWEGDIIIRNCTFAPARYKSKSLNLINGTNSGQHDFGYICYMPERIIIENLDVNDSNHPENYQGPTLFSEINENMIDDTYIQKFPYVITKEIALKNVTIHSKKALRISENPFIFRNMKISKGE